MVCQELGAGSYRIPELTKMRCFWKVERIPSQRDDAIYPRQWSLVAANLRRGLLAASSVDKGSANI